jgi:hypothetical protein
LSFIIKKNAAHQIAPRGGRTDDTKETKATKKTVTKTKAARGASASKKKAPATKKK